MKSWEFLIQKKGTDSWLALRTQKLKLTAGEYRLVARSHRPNVDVEIRVTHQTLDETNPKRRSQKRLARTNGDGLIALVPFIPFQPGLWQIRCSCDLMSELLGKPWSEVIQFHVSPQVARSEIISDTTPISEELTAESPAPEEVEQRPAIEIPAIVEQPKEIVVESPEEEFPAEEVVVESSEEETQTETEEIFDLNSLLDRSIQNLEHILQQANCAPPQETTASDPPPLTPESQEEQDSESTIELPLRLSLYHDNFVRYQDEPILISGQVDALNPEFDDLQAIFTDLGGTSAWLVLYYHLRDPQSAGGNAAGNELDKLPRQVLFDSRQKDGDTTLPKIFGYHLEIPEAYRNPLILGKVTLEVWWQRDLDERPSKIVLADLPFTIAAAVDELLEVAFASNIAPPLETETPPEPSVTPASFNTDFLDLIEKPPATHSESAIASPKFFRVTPRPTPSQNSLKSLQLPNFSSSAKQETPSPLQPEEIPQNPESPPISEDLVEPLPSDREEPIASTAVPEQIAPLDLEEAPSPIEQPTEPPIEPLEANPEFQALRLEERFWSRMNSLAEEASSFSLDSSGEVIPQASQSRSSELESDSVPPSEEMLEGDEPIPQVTLPLDSPAETIADVPLMGSPSDEEELEIIFEDEWTAIEPETTEPKEPPADRAIDWTSQEIVVDDDEELPPSPSIRQDASGLPYPKAVKDFSSKGAAAAQPDPDAVVPTPILQVHSGELVAGEPVAVRIKLPSYSNAVYVKLWIQDCHTHYIMEGPRALVDFTVNAEGELETLTQSIVPQGTLEIQFEAIAIDVESQRESRKAAVIRKVIPPDLPNVSLQNF
ncbi:hypothetical protein IQ249_20730 [Lusitaniella coriacea LEGE 07157]|uniref:Uncharacterized protein n=1 Tax=Lusitaniella coriacea LEGE 07157 TaxID=945747 RepID=A0A8J7IW11_9CYAN|nr:hypothetical protein [Lusitaniella coriacea]MBE9118322.1 hypothetical protein [Lusitaniella coriacea LEGE 07157]